MFAGEHPGPVRLHVEVPAGRRAAVQRGPGDDGPAHVAQGELLREGGRGPRGEELLVVVRLIVSCVILCRVVLLRQRRLGTETEQKSEKTPLKKGNLTCKQTYKSTRDGHMAQKQEKRYLKREGNESIVSFGNYPQMCDFTGRVNEVYF